MPELTWRKATRCGSSSCVEVATTQDAAHVRDSKDPDSPVLTFNREEWEAFLAGAKAGEFDDV